MTCRMEDLCMKSVINVSDGSCLGCVDDVVIDIGDAKVRSLVVFGRKKCFGLFGREPDIIIAWKDINMIGEDAILVCFSHPPKLCKKKKKKKALADLFQ